MCEIPVFAEISSMMCIFRKFHRPWGKGVLNCAVFFFKDVSVESSDRECPGLISACLVRFHLFALNLNSAVSFAVRLWLSCNCVTREAIHKCFLAWRSQMVFLSLKPEFVTF